MAKQTPQESLKTLSENHRAQIYKGVLDIVVLGLLVDGPEYGVKILDRLHGDAGLDVAAGSLYPLLHRMEAAGLIRATWRHDSSAHGRKYYSLTAAGTRDFEDQCAAWLTMSAKLNSFLRRKLQ